MGIIIILFGIDLLVVSIFFFYCIYELFKPEDKELMNLMREISRKLKTGEKGI